LKFILEIKFYGGLGNQLFQYATGRSLSIRHNITHLLLNTESYENIHLNNLGRSFSLNSFDRKGNIIRSRLLKNALRINTKLNNLVSVLPLYKKIEESGFFLHDLNDRLGFCTSIRGYWQSEFYFKDIRSTLLKELVPLRIPHFPSWLNNNHTVAVHVRRADYLTEGRYGFLGEKYYQDAMAFIEQKVQNPLFIFFSDDLEWCEANFKAENILFCRDHAWQSEDLQLYLMSQCRHQIIANSSFSWWSAWLNDNPGRLIVRPLRPFIDKTLMYESYYPDAWVSLDN
jgi:hypothetical protein